MSKETCKDCGEEFTARPIGRWEWPLCVECGDARKTEDTREPMKQEATGNRYEYLEITTEDAVQQGIHFNGWESVVFREGIHLYRRPIAEEQTPYTPKEVAAIKAMAESCDMGTPAEAHGLVVGGLYYNKKCKVIYQVLSDTEALYHTGGMKHKPVQINPTLNLDDYTLIRRDSEEAVSILGPVVGSICSLCEGHMLGENIEVCFECKEAQEFTATLAAENANRVRIEKSLRKQLKTDRSEIYNQAAEIARLRALNAYLKEACERNESDMVDLYDDFCSNEVLSYPPSIQALWARGRAKKLTREATK